MAAWIHSANALPKLSPLRGRGRQFGVHLQGGVLAVVRVAGRLDELAVADHPSSRPDACRPRIASIASLSSREQGRVVAAPAQSLAGTAGELDALVRRFKLTV